MDKAQCWIDTEELLDNGIDRIILFGPAGTGKTYAGLNFKPVEQPSYRLICTDDMTTADISGLWIPSENGFDYQEGVAITAWRKGARLVIDEINRASGDILSLLLAITDTNISSSWRNPKTGEIVTPQKGFSVVMTMNGEPEDLDEALVDRFPCRIRVNRPHPTALATLPWIFRQPAYELADGERNERVSLRTFMAISQLMSYNDKTNSFNDYGLKLDRAVNLVIPHLANGIIDAIEVSQLERGSV